MNQAASAAIAVLALTRRALGADLVTYDLPADSARYTIRAETHEVKTGWEYTSDRPTKPDAPTSQPCIADVVLKDPGACRPEPLIFPRYDLGLRLDNTAEAHELHPGTADAAKWHVRLPRGSGR